jgi:hypothetical protein
MRPVLSRVIEFESAAGQTPEHGGLCVSLSQTVRLVAFEACKTINLPRPPAHFHFVDSVCSEAEVKPRVGG